MKKTVIKTLGFLLFVLMIWISGVAISYAIGNLSGLLATLFISAIAVIWICGALPLYMRIMNKLSDWLDIPTD